MQIGLKKASNGTNDYSVATFKKLYDFEGEELAQIRAYANSFKEQIKSMLTQRAIIQDEQKDNSCDYEGPTLPASDKETHFCISTEINGERDALPA